MCRKRFSILGGFLALCVIVATALAAQAGTLFLSPATALDPNTDNYTNISGITAISTTNGSYYNFAGNSPPGAPTGMAVDTNGYLYVAYGSANVILGFTPSGQYLLTSACTNGPGPLSFDASDHLYSANADGSISVINELGSVSNYASLPGTASGIAVAANGNLFALVGTSIYLVATNRSVSLYYNLSPYVILNTSGLAVDNQSNLFVAAAGFFYDGYIYTNQILEVSTGGTLAEKAFLSSTYHDVPDSAAGPAVDSLGNVYLSFFARQPVEGLTIMAATNGAIPTLARVAPPFNAGALLAYSPFDIHVSDQPFLPTIIRQPQSQTVTIGTTATFSVGAIGGPLTYQWYFDDTNALNPSNALSGATNSTLTLTNVQPAQTGTYTVLVSNSVGPVVSLPGQLNVLPGLSISLVPAILLKGGVGLTYDLQYVNAVGSGNTNWNTLATITLTNTQEFYPDFSAIGQPTRFYRLIQVP